MILWRVIGEGHKPGLGPMGGTFDVWFATPAQAQALVDEVDWTEGPICRRVPLPRSREGMCDLLNTIGGCNG